MGRRSKYQTGKFKAVFGGLAVSPFVLAHVLALLDLNISLLWAFVLWLPLLFGLLGLGVWPTLLRGRMVRRMRAEGARLGLTFRRSPGRGHSAALDVGEQRLLVHADWDYGGWLPVLGFRAVLDASLPPRLNIAVHEPGAFDFEIPREAREGLLARVTARYSPRTVARGTAHYRTGVASFDRGFVLREAREADLLCVAGARSRAAIRVAVGGGGLRVEDGQIVWRGLGVLPSEEELAKTTSLMVELAAALEESAGVPIPEGLLQHIKSDPELGFRVRCFEVLVGSYPGSLEATEALALGEASPVPSLRFLAACHKTPPPLDLISELVEGGELPERLRARGLAIVSSIHAGGLSLGDRTGGGRLSLPSTQQGGLSEPDPPPSNDTTEA